MMKDNIVTLDWDDEILAETVLTHEGKPRSDQSEHAAYPSNAAEKAAHKAPGKAA
jgi:NAD(P) transhydrogenase subunit alpha